MIFIIYGNLFIKRNAYPSLHHLTVNGLQCTSRQVLFQPLSQHPVHSDCKRYTSRSGNHGIADTSLWLHVHFWKPGAKRCPSKEWRRINMIRFPGEIFWTFFFLTMLWIYSGVCVPMYAWYQLKRRHRTKTTFSFCKINLFFKDNIREK